MASTAPHLDLPRQALEHYPHAASTVVPKKYPQPAVIHGPTFSNQINLVVTKYTYLASTPGGTLNFIGLGWRLVIWSFIKLPTHWMYMIGFESLM